MLEQGAFRLVEDGQFANPSAALGGPARQKHDIPGTQTFPQVRHALTGKQISACPVAWAKRCGRSGGV
jgi:hypothetical protein